MCWHAGRDQQQALVSQLWQELFQCVFWSQTSIKTTLTPSTIARVHWREKVSLSLFWGLETSKPIPVILSETSVSSSRAGATWPCGGHVSSPAFTGAGSCRRKAAGWGWCWGSPVPVHSCYRGYFTHAVQLHVSLVVLGTRGTAGQPSVYHCNSSACQWPSGTCPPHYPQSCRHQSGWLDETDGRYFNFDTAVDYRIHSSPQWLIVSVPLSSFPVTYMPCPPWAFKDPLPATNGEIKKEGWRCASGRGANENWSGW